jgi:segregation and condensation protein A
MPYEVRTPAFSGPLDLLLRLIEERRLDVTTIALAEVTDQYLAQLRQLETPDPNELADFLVIAARLVLLKSRFLLPTPHETTPDDEAIDLAAQLRAFQRFKQASEALRARLESGARSYAREVPPPILPPRPLPAGGGRPSDLLQAYLRWRAGQAPPSRPLAGPRVRLLDKLRQARDALVRWGRVRFSALARWSTSRLEVVVLFLAVLELQRRGLAEAEQPLPFGEIELRATPSLQCADGRLWFAQEPADLDGATVDGHAEVVGHLGADSATHAAPWAPEAVPESA